MISCFRGAAMWHLKKRKSSKQGPVNFNDVLLWISAAWHGSCERSVWWRNWMWTCPDCPGFFPVSQASEKGHMRTDVKTMSGCSWMAVHASWRADALLCVLHLNESGVQHDTTSDLSWKQTERRGNSAATVSTSAVLSCAKQSSHQHQHVSSTHVDVWLPVYLAIHVNPSTDNNSKLYHAPVWHWLQCAVHQQK